MEELLREAACVGNLDGVRKILHCGANVNSQNSVNGWTALHWACKRGHKDIVTFLLQSGADIDIATYNGEKAVALTRDTEIAKLVGASDQETLPLSLDTLPIIPNYLRSPPFPYVDLSSQIRDARDSKEWILPPPPSSPFPTLYAGVSTSYPATSDTPSKLLRPSAAAPTLPVKAPSLLVRARLAESNEVDYVEVLLVDPTFRSLLDACCEELEVDPSRVVKVRKLPDVLVRKDADVARLTGGERIELVLST